MGQTMDWYWNRLWAMTPKEVTYRGKFTLKKWMWQRKKKWVAPICVWSPVDRWVFTGMSDRLTMDMEQLLAEAERYLHGKYCLLNFTFQEEEIDWHRDPQTGKVSPMEFGPNLNYRDPAVSGNVKNIWEKNRHHHLTVLSLAYALTADDRYANKVVEQLGSWVEQNPFPLGVNWTSSLEAGVRLISWVWIERCLRKSAQHDILFGEAGLLWPAVYWHQWLIAEHYSHGSSANNHLVGEMAGLYLASLVWPYYPQSAQWRTFAKQTLEQEAVKQTFPGGLNREQAFSYHLFSLEFFLLCAIEGERLSDDYSPEYKERVRRMLEVIPLVTDVGGNVPRYGDEDQGMALQLRSMGSSRLDWLYHLGRLWLQAELPAAPGEGELTARLILAQMAEGKALSDTAPSDANSAVPVSVEDSGHYILKSRPGRQDEIFCLAHAGPLGYLSIAGHGHADALSFTLNVGGVPVIVDPGTYIYHADPKWREYFRSTKAHNTVTMDDKSQSVAGGLFLWEKKADTEVLTWEPDDQGGVLVARHDGYAKQQVRAKHCRELALCDRQLTVTDRISGEGTHQVEFRLHFSPRCRLMLEQYHCHVRWNGGRLEIKLDERMHWSLLRGEQDAGWYSAGFNLKEPAFTLTGSLLTKLPIEIINLMEVYNEN